MVQWAKCFLLECEGPEFGSPRDSCEKKCVASHICNPSTRKEETRGSLELTGHAQSLDVQMQ